MNSLSFLLHTNLPTSVSISGSFPSVSGQPLHICPQSHLLPLHWDICLQLSLTHSISSSSLAVPYHPSPSILSPCKLPPSLFFSFLILIFSPEHCNVTVFLLHCINFSLMPPSSIFILHPIYDSMTPSTNI